VPLPYAQNTAEVITNPESQFSLQIAPNGTEILSVVLPETSTESQKEIMGRSVPTRTVTRKKQEITLSGTSLTKLQAAHIKLADGTILGDPIAKR